MRVFFKFAWLPYAAIAATAPLQVDHSTCGKSVATTNGPIVGHVSSKSTDVCEYLGIPYALPPIGDLRFAPPKEFTRNQTYVANEYSPDCPQPSPRQVLYPDATPQELRIVANFANQANNHTQSEDCLTLNIWTKPSSRTDKPTLVFLHGGRYTGGTSNTPFYTGHRLASAHDLIIATLNFRLNIFGFPGAPSNPQNLGLLDQRRAVEWLRANVAAFGGSPDKITLVGQSSGSVAVDAWAFAFRGDDDALVSGLVSHSGNVFSFPVNSGEVAARAWYNVSARVGCGDGGDVMACMRAVPWREIRDAASTVRGPPSGSIARSIPAFQATVDGVVIFGDYYQRSRAGAFAPVPYLQGVNDYESGYYKIPTYGNGNATAPEDVWRAFQLESFTCASAVAAYHRARAGVPTWRWRYFGDWENLRLYPGSGAYHGSEMNMVVGNSEEVSGLVPSVDQESLTAETMRAYAAFAEDPAKGLNEIVEWPKYDADEPTLIRLGYENSPVPDFVFPGTYDEECASLGLSYWDPDLS